MVAEYPIDRVTTNAEEAIDGADILFSAVPAFAHRMAAELTAPHLRRDAAIVVFTGGLGGLEWVADAHRRGVEPDFLLVETHTLPYAARVRAPGEVTILLDLKHVMGAAYPAKETARAAALLKRLYPQIEFGRDLIEPALCNVNGVMHPPVMLLNVPRIERSRGRPWFVWEEGLTPSVATLIEHMDAERAAIGKAYGLRLADLAELEWQSGYGPRGTIYETLTGSPALRDIAGPASVNERFLTEDIPYFLRGIVDLAQLAGVDCPLMRAFTEIGSAIIGWDVWSGGRTLESFRLRPSSTEELCRGLYEGFSAEDFRNGRQDGTRARQP